MAQSESMNSHSPAAQAHRPRAAAAASAARSSANIGAGILAGDSATVRTAAANRRAGWVNAQCREKSRRGTVLRFMRLL